MCVYDRELTYKKVKASVTSVTQSAKPLMYKAL